jgi:hypothetical protein
MTATSRNKEMKSERRTKTKVKPKQTKEMPRQKSKATGRKAKMKDKREGRNSKEEKKGCRGEKRVITLVEPTLKIGRAVPGCHMGAEIERRYN